MISQEAKISALKKLEQIEIQPYFKQVLTEVIKELKDDLKHNGMKGCEHSYKIYMDHKTYLKFIELMKK